MMESIANPLTQQEFKIYDQYVIKTYITTLTGYMRETAGSAIHTLDGRSEQPLDPVFLSSSVKRN